MLAAWLALAAHGATLSSPEDARDLRQQLVPEVSEMRVAVSVGADGNLQHAEAASTPEPQALPMASLAPETTASPDTATDTTTRAAVMMADSAHGSKAEDAFINDVLAGPINVEQISHGRDDSAKEDKAEKAATSSTTVAPAVPKAAAAAASAANSTNATAPMSGSMNAFNNMVTSSLIRIRAIATSMLSITPRVKPVLADPPTSLVQDQASSEDVAMQGLKSHGQKRSLNRDAVEMQRDLLWDSLSSGMSMMSSHDMGPSRVPALLELQHSWEGAAQLPKHLLVLPVFVFGLVYLAASHVQSAAK